MVRATAPAASHPSGERPPAGQPGSELSLLLDTFERRYRELEDRARSAFRGGPVTASRLAFHGGSPELTPFLIYRIPGLIREAGAYTPAELRNLAAGSSEAWLKGLLLRHLALVQGVWSAADALERGTIPPHAFPAIVAGTARVLNTLPAPASPAALAGTACTQQGQKDGSCTSNLP